MLEIIAVVILCRHLGNKVREKGRKPIGYQILLVFSWLFGELAAGFLYGIYYFVQHGVVPEDFGLEIYVLALLGASLGAACCFLLVYLLPPIDGYDDMDEVAEPSAVRTPVRDSNNPYSYTEYDEERS